jgi:hypothetical protein
MPSDLSRPGPARTVRDLKLAYLIPASPTDGFYAQTAMMRLALDALGPPYRDARVCLAIGGGDGASVPQRWRNALSRVDVAFFQGDTGEPSFRAQVQGRWSMVPLDTDIVVLGNADTLAVARCDELLERVVTEQIVAGAIVHGPLQFPDGVTPAAGWGYLARRVFGRDVDLDYLTLLPNVDGVTDPTPYYVNGGVVLMARSVFDRLHPVYCRLEPQVARLLVNPMFSHQASLALAILQTQVPRLAIDIRYNFPNDVRADDLYPDDLADVRTIHYLRTTEFDRRQIFVDADVFDRFLALPLAGSNAVMQQRVRELTGRRYPFA